MTSAAIAFAFTPVAVLAAIFWPGWADNQIYEHA